MSTEEEQQNRAAKRIKTEQIHDNSSLVCTKRNSEATLEDAAIPDSAVGSSSNIAHDPLIQEPNEAFPETVSSSAATTTAAPAIKEEQQVAAMVKKEEKDQATSSCHFRSDCPVHSFNYESGHMDELRSFCPKCLCYACNAPASECPQWKWSHHGAHSSQVYWKARHEETCEIQQWLANPVIDLFENTYETVDFDAFRVRCRDARFYYADKATFEKALCIYNSQSARKTTLCFPVVKQRHSFQRKEVRGIHKNPCFDCGRHFRKHMNYFVNVYAVGFSTTKYCLGCMGRIVAHNVSPDASELDRLEQEQKERIDLLQEECDQEFHEMERQRQERFDALMRSMQVPHRA